MTPTITAFKLKTRCFTESGAAILAKFECSIPGLIVMRGCMLARTPDCKIFVLPPKSTGGFVRFHNELKEAVLSVALEEYEAARRAKWAALRGAMPTGSRPAMVWRD